MDIYPLKVIPVLALILCLISALIVIINPNNYKPVLAQQREQEQQENKQSALSIVGNMRENGHNLTATNRPPLNANSTYYTFTKNRSEVSTPENNSHTNEFGKGARIALVNPTFTSAAYNNSFYVFYEKHSNTLYGVNVTSDLDLLSNTVINNKKELSSSISSMIYLLKNIKSITSQPNITLLTDVDVDNGTIFEKKHSGNNIAVTNNGGISSDISNSDSGKYINAYSGKYINAYIIPKKSSAAIDNGSSNPFASSLKPAIPAMWYKTSIKIKPTSTIVSFNR
jgi:hypothetical protein